VRLFLLATIVAWAGAARAQEDPDTQVGRRHFRVGSERYAAGDYAGALEEFRAARRVTGLPALDYNIARCEDRLEQYSDAIADYERYVAAAPNADDAAEVSARIAVLRSRVAQAASASRTPSLLASPPARPPSRRRIAIGLAVGASIAVVLGVSIGLGLGLQRTDAPFSGSLGVVRGP
jgi:tetratricopeptide (TPR) repeat protein